MLQIGIELQNAGKKYTGEWIFKSANLNFIPGSRTAILGANGSGKSTFLKLLCGYTPCSAGKIIYTNSSKIIEQENIYRYFTIAAPYIELIEEFNIEEMLLFYLKFKSFHKDISTEKLIKISEFERQKFKKIRDYSSGMKQRLKLALAIVSDCPLLFLDEPCSNLDKDTIHWYKEMIENYADGKTIVVCSNSLEYEYDFCHKTIKMSDLKYES